MGCRWAACCTGNTALSCLLQQQCIAQHNGDPERQALLAVSSMPSRAGLQQCQLVPLTVPAECSRDAASLMDYQHAAQKWHPSQGKQRCGEMTVWAGSLMHMEGSSSSTLQLTWSWLQVWPLLPLCTLLAGRSLLPRRALRLPRHTLLLPRCALLPRRTLLPPLWSLPSRVLWLDLHLHSCRRLLLGHVYRPWVLLCRQGLRAGLCPTCTTQQAVGKCL